MEFYDEEDIYDEVDSGILSAIVFPILIGGLAGVIFFALYMVSH